MARIRTIKPEFFDDPDVGDLSPWARLLFIGLWTQADRDGRLVADWRRLKARLFPFDAKCPDLSRLAVELHGKDMVRQYQDSHGRECLWIVKFLAHQRPHPKEPESTIEPWQNLSIQAQKDNAMERNGEPGKKTASQVDYGLLTMGNGSGNGSGVPAVPAVDDGFDAFWKAYPKKRDKGHAAKCWTKMKPSPGLQATILASIATQRTWRDWTKDDGQFIPNPATWLNGQGWVNEETTTTPPRPPRGDPMPPGTLRPCQQCGSEFAPQRYDDGSAMRIFSCRACQEHARA